MTGQDIENKILTCSDKDGDQQLRQLLKTISSVDHETIVDGIIRVFENTNRLDKTFRDQEFAGRILAEIRPKSTIDLNEILQRTLKNWDKSIEQFPLWLKDNYGMSKLKEVFGQIELSVDKQDKLETMKWWLKIKANA